MNPIIQNVARERLGKAAAHAPHPAPTPRVHGIDPGAAPGARNAAELLTHDAYYRQALNMGYQLRANGDWHHPGLGFEVKPIRYSWQSIDRQQTLACLRDMLYVHQSAVRGRRVFALGVLLVVSALMVLALLLWPALGHAQTARDEVARQALATDPVPLARCDHPYQLPAHGTGTLQCFHPGTIGKARAAFASGNPWVQVTLFEQREHPGYIGVTLHNLSDVPQRGVAVIEAWVP